MASISQQDVLLSPRHGPQNSHDSIRIEGFCRMFSKAQWQELKSRIEELYLGENYTLEQLAGYLKDNHGYKPTKKQLTYHISCWGFEKNVKRRERRMIIENFASLEAPAFQPRNIRGRQLDKAKLKRWMKNEGMKVGKEASSGSNAQLSPFDRQLDDICAPMDIDEQEVHYTSIHGLPNCLPVAFDWSLVDVPGSPRLTRLFGALTIAECANLPPLNGTASESDETTQVDDLDLFEAIITDKPDPKVGFEFYQHGGTYPSIHCGLNPFPSPSTVVSLSQRRRQSSFFRSTPLNENECLKLIRMLDFLDIPKLLQLVDSMFAHAWRYWDDFHEFLPTEKWFRRVITAKTRVLWYREAQSLEACVRITSCLKQSGKLLDARSLHNKVHAEIQRATDIDLEILMESKLNDCLLQDYFFSNKEEVECICREHLQESLAHLGLVPL